MWKLQGVQLEKRMVIGLKYIYRHYIGGSVVDDTPLILTNLYFAGLVVRRPVLFSCSCCDARMSKNKEGCSTTVCVTGSFVAKWA